jgi:hypothetical protein
VVAVGVDGAGEAVVAQVVRCRIGAIEEMRESPRSRWRGMRLAIPSAAACHGGIRGAAVVHGRGIVSDGSGQAMTFAMIATTAYAGPESERQMN